jgi:glycosyltransferase involved in cell wall biosynthesis
MKQIHCLGLPHTISNADYVACAFTQKVRKFLTMFKGRGYKTIHYGHPESVTDADEQVNVTSNEVLEQAYGGYDWRKGQFRHASDDFAHRVFNENAGPEIYKRKQRGDLVLAFWGGVRGACEFANKDGDLIVVEPGIGCGHAWAQFRCYESYPLKAAFQGTNGVSYCNPEWYGRVVPNYFDLRDFEPKTDRKPYAVALGRIGRNKGVDIAIDATFQAGVKLVVAGQGSCQDVGFDKWPDHVEYIGYADLETRKKLLGEASYSFLLSTYWEPFGGTAVESMLSGCVPICTDVGAMTEYIVDGVNGFRCNTMGDILRAMRLVDTIDRDRMIAFAQENFSLDAVRPKFQRAFADFSDVLSRKGFYEDHNRPLGPGLGLNYSALYR